MGLVEIFNNRQRLDQPFSVDFQRRHQALRVDAEEFRTALVAPPQMHRDTLVIQLFEIERDAHAERGGRTEIAVQLHARACQWAASTRRYSLVGGAGKPAARSRDRALGWD